MTYSRRDAIVLYLEGSAGYRDAEVVPRRFTVRGIAAVLETGTESTAGTLDLLADLQALRDDGHVEAVTRRVEGGGKRNVYLLTEAGRRRADALREELSDATVAVTDGTAEEVRFDELGRFFDGDPVVKGLARLEDGTIELDRDVGGTFVDRTAALETLATACEATVERGARAVVVSGPPGVGKTRLVRESVARGPGEAFVLAAAGARREGADPYRPLAEAFEALPDGPDLAALLEQASGGTPADGDDVDAGRRALFAEVADALRTASTDRPVALFVDDMQWADRATVALLDYLVDAVDEWIYPVLFLVGCRPAAVDDASPAAAFLERVAAAERHREVALSGLDRAATAALVERLAGVETVPGDYLDRLVPATGGNPLFVREAVAEQIDDGRLDPASGSFPTDAAAFEVPDSVAAAVEERFAALSGDARAVLEAAAVAGERVGLDRLAAVVDSPPAAVRDYADVLAASGLWAVEDGRVRFTSGLLRDAVREHVAPADERRYHRRVAAALADDEDQAGHAAAADHYRAAGDDEAAVEQYVAAADRAAAVYAHDLAVEQYEAALGLVANDARAAGICRRLAEIRLTTGDYDAAAERVAAARDHGPAGDERRRVAAVAARLALRREDPAAALATVQEALPGDDDPDGELPEKLATTVGTAELLGVAAEAAYRQGDFTAAYAAAERQLAVAEAVDDTESVAAARRRLGVVDQQRAELPAADEHLQAARGAYEAIGDRHGAAKARLDLGNVARTRSDYPAAETHYEAAHSVFRDVGDDHNAAKALASLGTVAMNRDDLEGAREYYRAARETFEAVGDRAAVARIRGNLGIVAREDGDLATARDHYERALATFRDLGNRHGAAITRHDLGNVARMEGDLAAASEHLTAALSTYRELDDSNGIALVRSSLGTLSEDRGDPDAAREQYEAALSLHREIDDRRGAAAARRYLGRLALERGDLGVAREHLGAARETFADLGLDGLLAEVRLLQGRVALATAALDDARDHLEAAIDGLAGDDEAAAARARGFLAAAEARRGDQELARDLGEEALATAADHDTWLRRAVEAAAARGDDAAARDWCERALAVLEDGEQRDWFERRRGSLGG